jgi:elongation factor Ts
MAEVTAQMVKELRELTGAGPKDCKAALEQNSGDVKKAADFLREKGMARAVKKLGATDRSTHEGIIEVYSHFNKLVAAMVEVNCETDFVAKTDAFRTFAKDMALHVANMNPQYVNPEDVPAELVEAEKKVLLATTLEENPNKPEAVREKIVEGRLKKFYADICLMEQPFIKDDGKTIRELLQEVVAQVGERVEIRRFARFAIEKPTQLADA